MESNGKRQPLLIVGSLAFDSVETPTGKVEMALGGSASYAAIAASYHCRPQVVGVVGDDFTEEHLRRFEDHAVDVKGIEKAEGKTFHWRGRYHDNFKERDTLETSLNVFELFDPVIPSEYRDTRFVFLGNIDPTLQLKVLLQMNKTTLVAMDTMNFWIETARDALAETLSRVDLLFINDEEALQLSGESSLLGASEKILSMGPDYVVVKRGEYGAVLFGPETRLYVPAVLLPEVVDPTGAGDSFAGGFMGYLAGRDRVDRSVLARALITGTVEASFSVEAFSVDGICGLDAPALEARQAQLEDMIRF